MKYQQLCTKKKNQTLPYGFKTLLSQSLSHGPSHHKVGNIAKYTLDLSS